MRMITNEELIAVAGGDAAATRTEGTNSWGETPEQAADREAAKAPNGTLEIDMRNCEKGDNECYERAYEKYQRAVGNQT